MLQMNEFYILGRYFWTEAGKAGRRGQSTLTEKWFFIHQLPPLRFTIERRCVGFQMEGKWAQNPFQKIFIYRRRMQQLFNGSPWADGKTWGPSWGPQFGPYQDWHNRGNRFDSSPGFDSMRYRRFLARSRALT